MNVYLHTYMKELQRQYHYWIIILHGDWHTLQLLAETIRDILWDGRLKQLAYQCRQKELPTQWQDVHIFLLALCEILMSLRFIASVDAPLDTKKAEHSVHNHCRSHI